MQDYYMSIFADLADMLVDSQLGKAPWPVGVE